ncbi:ubiquitin carboxyl-terminal hydrolase 5 [Condylostylus longicornis]|uniref:ubiquitin carboxyl-terminal hydrolase 5 n=1 Tax=Condylostylus longicornis TaxID=2530218 RepID=UPI00244DB91B|nr:ubiquitin carboxyl-terminal hydrolase 5 [Condylostylus longicornis]
MECLQNNLSKIRVPNNFENVYKDECVYSFDTPESPTGLYISLTSFLGFGEDFVEGYAKKTGNHVYLHWRREKYEIPQEQLADGPEKKITRLAIGVEGGFDPNIGKKKFEYKDFYNIIVFPEKKTYSYPDENLPMIISQSVKAIIDAESAIKKLEKSSLAGTWDGEVRQVSKFAKDLRQLENGIKIPPSGWKCEKCDLTNNLWLNLTDGSILCGRKFFDGSGGNDHAVEHYHETRFPLAVKLGTITAEGKGDVFSYAEDDMVEDPYLVDHLAHFGIKVAQMTKTEKSMVELELDINQKIGEWDILTESNSNLIPMSGPGYTGMKNLGNSCYLNSVMQVLFTIPDFVKRFVLGASDYFATYPDDPANDFNIQMAKLGTGLCSGKYSSIPDNSLDSESTGISPAMFKNLIGKNHPDFSTKHQQDAQEFFLHLINILDRNSRNQENPANALKFSIEDRVECQASKKVKYTTRDEYCLPLQIPLKMATNLDEVKEYEEKLAEAQKNGQKLPPDSLVRPKITLKACLDAFSQSEIIEQYYSTAIRDKTSAKKTSRLATMPDYLMLHLKKFMLREDWTSMKLDVSIDIPDILDLSSLKSSGLQPGEELLPELDDKTQLDSPPMDEKVLNSLVEMGFPIDACKRAIFSTKNSGLEPATQWIMEHITDSDFNDRFVPPGLENQKSGSFRADPNSLEMLMGMGFNEIQAIKALKATENNIERATDWIFSHQGDLDGAENDEEPCTPKMRDGSSKYRLVGFISHMGTSSQVGHYVCHLLKDNQWIIFNDSKVAISQNPPKELGYLYLYERV